ncbi:unnamed protein product [Bursaphelenchus okinawaensis]|uniref:SH2 domain-containing protein n=1 Tax=Bursaphelenchus okinawaensis TaxID=465554 RepID=A0A811LIP2_9BILA|nr:unnamed protein product [Bursaphelenchus okinawaensis]CAG9124395.1 unnamed protein product [Bursaphelenchus okinawaensis]
MASFIVSSNNSPSFASTCPTFSPGKSEKIDGSPEVQSPKKKFCAPHWLDQVRDLDIFHGRLSKFRANRLLKKNGDYLLRSAMDKRDGFLKLVLSVKCDEKHYHFLIKESFGLYRVGTSYFQSIPSLLAYHQNSGEPVQRQSTCILTRPVLTGLSVQSYEEICLKEKENPTKPQTLGIEPYTAEDKDMPEILTHFLNVLLASIGITFLYLVLYY